MKRTISCLCITLMVAIIITACGGTTKEQREKADQLIESAHKLKNYERMLALADSLEQTGSLSPEKADFWRGYAYDRTKQPEKAIASWQKAMEASVAQDDGDMDTYAKAASRLANLLAIKGDYKGALEMAEPAAKRLETLKRDTTSDYENLILSINLCRVSVGGSDAEIEDGFDQTYERFMENIQKNRSDASYKSAIAGLINIAYFCIQVKKYKYALYYTRNFGELLAEYEQRQGVSADYIDRQLGRYDIYKAMALKGLGQKEEADQVFEAYQETKFSQTPEGQTLADDYRSDGGQY